MTCIKQLGLKIVGIGIRVLTLVWHVCVCMRDSVCERECVRECVSVCVGGGVGECVGVCVGGRCVCVWVCVCGCAFLRARLCM